MPTRRDFLRCSCAAAPFAAALPGAFVRALAGSVRTNDRVLVLIRLGGGNDGLNTVIPAEDDRYHRARPTLRVAKDRALPLAGELFLHPSLEGLRALHDRGRLAVVTDVGYAAPDRSHFRSMDIWHTAYPDREDRRTGWVGRVLDDSGSAISIPAVAVVEDQLPLALLGERLVAPVVPSLDEFVLQDDVAAALAAAPRADTGGALARVLATARSAAATSEKVARARHRVPFDAFPPSALGRQLATTLALLRSGLGTRVFYVAHDGFDTHSQQADNHASLLKNLGDSVRSFQDALDKDGLDRQVLVLTFSEFGRRVRENGSKGTDHGAAAPLFAVSSALEPGVIGGPPDLDDLDDGDLRHRVDFRRVYATVIERWLDLDSLPALGARFEPLPFLV